MDGFDKLAVQLITLALSLADMNKEKQSTTECPLKGFPFDGGWGRGEGGGGMENWSSHFPYLKPASATPPWWI